MMSCSSYFAHLYISSPEENSSSKALYNPTKLTHSNMSELHLKTLAFTSLTLACFVIFQSLDQSLSSCSH